MNNFKLFFSKYGWIIIVALCLIALVVILCLMLNFNPFLWISSHIKKFISFFILLGIIIIGGISLLLALKFR